MAREDSKGKSILLIEDEEDLVATIKFRLKANGYAVVTANDGIEALRQLDRMTPDLIILDVNLPRMGGIEFYNKISTPYGHSKYPVLVLTARADLEKLFKDIEADGFIAKPFEVGELIKEVERIISGASSPTVFLIDYKEDPRVRKIEDCLKAERYAVVCLDEFRQLQEKAREKRPVFIIMEYMQKDISGEAFIRQIKEGPDFNDIPVIVYSYSGFEEYGKKSLQAGADKYLGKPENCDILLKAMQELKHRKF